MKRHEVLIPISREHHKLLLLAQLLKKDAPPYKGMPTDVAGKLNYLKNEWERLVKHNIYRCNEILTPFLKQQEAFPADLIKTLESETTSVIRFYDEAIYFQNENYLDQLGYALEKYTRTVERQIFQEMQNTFSSQSFNNLKNLLNTA